MAVYCILVTLLLLALLAIGIFSRRQTTREIEGLEQNLAEARQKLLDLSKCDLAREEFVANVSHELRTPLTSIRGALGLFSAGVVGTFDTRAQNLLRIAITNTDRLFRLVNDLLDLERIKSGRATLQLARCSLDDLIRHAIETMTVTAESARIKLEYTPSGEPQAVGPSERRIATDPPPGAQQRTGTDRRQSKPPNPAGVAPLFVDADPDRLLQVLLNLLSNAIKFSPPGTAVTVRVAASPDLVHLRVADQGRGIPTDLLETVFNRFQQAEAGDAQVKGGTGLGLAICRGIVHQHGGTIWAERNPVSGTTLCINLPRTNRASDPLPPSATAFAPPPGTPIIVCDKDPGLRVVTAEHLRRNGYSVSQAGSGEQILQLIAQHSPAVILLDLNLFDCFGLLAHARSAATTVQPAIIIVSVMSDTSGPALPFKPQGWVQKPFTEYHLINEIGRVIQTTSGNRQDGR